MKKKILAILLVVSMVAALAVGLTACNKDKSTAPAKADNAETLGTAIAVAMNSSAAGTASAEGDENVDPSFTINGIGAIPGISAATDELAKYLNEYVNNAQAYIKDHSVGVDNACKVNVKVELGKISDTETGAKVYVDVAVGATDKELVKVNVVANVISNANATNLDKTDFAINGTAVVIVAGSANVNVDISGVAKYVPGEPEVENGKYVVQVSGNASVQVGA